MKTLVFHFEDRYSLGYAILGNMIEKGPADGRTNLVVDPQSRIYDPLQLTETFRLDGQPLPDRAACSVPGVTKVVLREDGTEIVLLDHTAQ